MDESKNAPVFEETYDDRIYSEILMIYRAHALYPNIDCGSAAAAQAVRIFLADDDEVHPRSEYAIRMRAIIEGAVAAAVDRIADEFGWLDAETSRADVALGLRRRTHPCEGLLADGPRCNKPAPIEQIWCDDCEAEHEREFPA